MYRSIDEDVWNARDDNYMQMTEEGKGSGKRVCNNTTVSCDEVNCTLSGRYAFLQSDAAQEHKIVINAQAVLVHYLGYGPTYALAAWLRALVFDVLHDDRRGEFGLQCGYLRMLIYTQSCITKPHIHTERPTYLPCTNG